MPAQEQTWRNQKRMHSIFAAACAAMLLATVWMLLDDHTREWKKHQIKFRAAEIQMNNWQRLAHLTETRVRVYDDLAARLLALQSQPLDEAKLEEFRETAKEALSEEGSASEDDLSEVDSAVTEFNKLAADAAAARRAANEKHSEASATRYAATLAQTKVQDLRKQLDAAQADAEKLSQLQSQIGSVEQRAESLVERAKEQELEAHQLGAKAIQAEQAAKEAREEVLAALRAVIADVRFLEDGYLDERKTLQGILDAEKGVLGIAVREGRTEEYEPRQQKIDGLKSEIAELTENYGRANDHRKKLESLLKEMTAEADAVAKELDDARSELSRLAAANVERRSTFFSSDFPFLGKKWLEMPILDAFNSPLEIKNLWDEDNTIDINFRRIRRFDRCTTCHQAMQKTMPGSATEPAIIEERFLDFVLQTPSREEAEAAKQRYKELLRDWARRAFLAGKLSADEAVAELSQANWPAGEAAGLIAAWQKERELRGEEVERDPGVRPTLEFVLYGIYVADEGEYLLNRDDVTLSFVQPYSEDVPVANGELKEPPSSRAAQAFLALSAEETQPVDGGEIGPKQLHAQPHPSPDNLAVKPGLMAGDVLVEVNGDVVTGRNQAIQLLLHPTRWGEPLRVRVRRGMPHPYTSHPRLDLFVGSLSPHKMSTFACTICHEGQGSATSFKWASHTPNNPLQRERWSHDYGWFDNVHWIYPMYPKRFIEATCIKCHHEVTELEPSKKFPDPPAPKVVHGYDLIRKFGCYGCHEISGYDGPDKRVGPDLRLEPNFFAAALQLQSFLPERFAEVRGELEELRAKLPAARAKHAELQEQKEAKQAEKEELQTALPDDLVQRLQKIDAEIAKIDAEMREQENILNAVPRAEEHLKRLREIDLLAAQVAHHPDDDGARRQLQLLLSEDQEDYKKPEDGDSILGPQEHNLAALLKEAEAPGKMRKSGPSLRYVGAKLDQDFLFDWIRDPTNFRPSTHMPRFFGHWDHLDTSELPETKQYERLEIAGMAKYLLERSQPFEYTPLESEQQSGFIAESSQEEKVERGKRLFQTRGCLACHDHEAFGDIKPYRPKDAIVPGPDLSDLAGKFDPQRNPQGAEWLYTWLKNPSQYHARTLMPDVKLEPLEERDAEGNLVARTDPAEDIAAFLIHGAEAKWKAPAPQIDLKLLDQMVEENLRDWVSVHSAKEYTNRGVPERLVPDIKGAEVEMVVTGEEEARIEAAIEEMQGLMQEEVTDNRRAMWNELLEQKKLLYIGRKAIGKYGCYGCHDIPGFEDAKPIGTGLANWGRKEPSKLAFEHITQFLDTHGWWPAEEQKGQFGEQDREFYEHQLRAGHREGFIYQKLREPRSFDYHKTENLKYNERLRMPLFNLTDQQREAVITFVLGLVAEPPKGKFVYKPSPAQQAIITGRQVLDKYNCAGCHMLELEKWDIAYPQGHFYPPAPITPEPFPSVVPEFTRDELQRSQQLDRQGKMHATLVGLPSISSKGVPDLLGPDPDFPTEQMRVQEGFMFSPAELTYRFDLWEPVALDGRVYQVKGATPAIPAKMIERRYPTSGGDLTKYLLPRVIQMEEEAGSAAAQKGAEAWGWLPPALVGQGSKVQPEWVQEFLLDPHRIRPAVVLEMPKFNMSPEEAQQIADYFVAADGADYPYAMEDRERSDTLAHWNQSADSQASPSDVARIKLDQEARFDGALNIIADKNFCRQCHIVGDFDPGGNPRGNGPDLAQVYHRLRPSYVRDWVARPSSILPYTGMPVNIKYEPTSHPYLGGVDQELYPGTSIQQLDGLTEFLMNYDAYTAGQVSIAEIIQEREVPEESGEMPPVEGSGQPPPEPGEDAGPSP